MELFPITLPKSNICTETELYYRSSEPVQYEEKQEVFKEFQHIIPALSKYVAKPLWKTGAAFFIDGNLANTDIYNTIGRVCVNHRHLALCSRDI